MGFLDNILGTKKKPAKLYGLSELGRHKSEDMIGSNGVRLKVINYLEEHGESSCSEIAAGIGQQQEKVQMMLDKLTREQWVTINKKPAGD
jgi:DNA-binding MarR family transcriptional regulator